MDSISVDLLTKIVTASIALSALFVSLYNMSHNKLTAKAEWTDALLSEWRKEIEPDGVFVYMEFSQMIAENPAIVKRGFSHLDADTKRRVTNVSHFFDMVGWAALSERLDKPVLLTQIGPRVLQCWTVLEGSIRTERIIQSREEYTTDIDGRHFEPYLAGFEHLAEFTYKNYFKFYMKPLKVNFKLTYYHAHSKSDPS